MVSGHNQQSHKKILRISRVRLPQYELEYRNVSSALIDARTIKERGSFQVEYPLEESVGNTIVIEFSVKGMVTRVTLLFRVLANLSEMSVLEWWARRSNDADLLSMWSLSLEQHDQNNFAAESAEIDPSQRSEMLDLYRRLIAHNPFSALNVHWLTSEQEILESYNKIRDMLRTQKLLTERDRALARFWALGKAGLEQAWVTLGSKQGRAQARSRYVPRNQILHAIEVLKDKLVLAQMRGLKAQQIEQTKNIQELHACLTLTRG